MTKQIKEFLLEEETGFANVEYDDGSTLRFNLANLGSGWVINRYSARKIRLENATEEQVIVAASRYFPEGSKIRLNIWGDATVTLKSTDLPGTAAGTVTVAAFRLQIA